MEKAHSNFLVILSLLVCILLPVRSYAIELTILTENYPPYNYSEEKNGRVIGFTTELVEAILKETGNEHLTIELYPWKRAYMMVQKEPNILLFTMTRTKERENLFKWVGPVAERVQWLWKLKKRTDINIKTLKDAENYTITVVPDSAVYQYLVSQGFKDEKQLRPIYDGNLSTKIFLVGHDDLLFDTKLGMAYRLKLLGKSADLVEPVLALPSTGNYYLAFSLRTPDSTVSLFQEVLDNLKSNGTFNRILQKYTK